MSDAPETVRIDGFELLGSLGRRGVGSVYLARYRGDCLVALKLVGGSGAAAARRFARECRLLMAVRHPAIVTAFTTGTLESGIGYLVMEYVDGCTARDLRRRLGVPLTPAECAELLLPIADALAYCHSRGIFHGAVCPDNILVREDDRNGSRSPKLVDFGGSVAGGADGDTPRGVAPIAMDFQPLERLASDAPSPEQGESGDVYALAATAWFLTAGRGGAGRVLTNEERSGEASLDGEVDDAWRAMLAFALHPDPGQRMPSMALFRSLLRAWLPDAADREDGSRFEPYWVRDATAPLGQPDLAPTEPIEAETEPRVVGPGAGGDAWWLNLMLDALPSPGEPRRTGPVGAGRAGDPQPVRVLPLAVMGFMIAFIAGLSLSDVLQAPTASGPDCAVGAGVLTDADAARARDASLVNGHFRFVSALGSGGMGSVYLARYLGGCAVALKVVKHEPGGPNARELEDRFERECRILMGLRHPAIVTAYTHGRIQGTGQRFLALEYVPGLTLAQHRQRLGRPLTPAEAASLLIPIADALSYCHAHRIFHRDLSPKNVLVVDNPDGALHIKLVDFGAGWRDEAEKLTKGVIFGNIDFQPLERFQRETQRRDPAQVGREVDLFGLAAIAYFLTGGSGGVGAILDIHQKVGSEPIEIDAQPAWSDLLTRAIGRDRSHEYPDMDAFQRALLRFHPNPAERAADPAGAYWRHATDGLKDEGDDAAAADARQMPADLVRGVGGASARATSIEERFAALPVGWRRGLFAALLVVGLLAGLVVG